MSVLVVGSVALDHLETPFGSMDQALGGSASFIALAASYLANDVRFVGVVGQDFPEEHITFFRSRGIDLGGLVRDDSGDTFSWGGRYHADMNHRDTLYTRLGVFEHFSPDIPTSWRRSDVVVLGNIHPALQMHVLDQIVDPRLVICDTMNLWIDISRDELLRTIARVDVLIVNDQEAAQLTGEHGAVAAGRALLALGPRTVVVKKGEHGALLIHQHDIFVAPAYPVERFLDPTGAGDSFAGGFAGWIAQSGDASVETFKTAVVYGTVLASFCVEQFSIDGLRRLDGDTISRRARAIRALTSFALPGDHRES